MLLPRQQAEAEARFSAALRTRSELSSVTFLPQFLGALPKARLPLRDQAYSLDSETLAPISSTKTSRLASTSSATRAPRPLSGTRRALPLPAIFFSAPSQAP